MRKPSPISISSPRETIDLAAGREFVEREKDRRGVVVDRDPGRADQSLEQRAGVNVAFAALARSRGRIRGSSSPAGWTSGPSGARPRLVCRTTPVALMTRRSDGRSKLGERAPRPAPRSAARRTRPASDFATRAAARARRISATTRACGSRARRGREALENFVDRRQIAELAACPTRFRWYRACAEGVQGITLGTSGRGSAWLERLVRDQEVGGSNPLAPTKFSIIQAVRQ